MSTVLMESHLMYASKQSSNIVNQIHNLIEQQRYGVEYQPIICTRSGEIMAYEALARFFNSEGQSISPLIVFEFLHQNLSLFNQVELDLKNLQIDYAPNHYNLFVNVDPHAIGQTAHMSDSPLLSKLTACSNIVVELIENSDIHEAKASMALHKLLNQQGIATALDDIGADHALLSLEILTSVNYLKFDRNWIKNLQLNNYSKLFQSLMQFARQTEKKTILEGIENSEMLLKAKSYGVDQIQGFLYRPLFRNVSP